MAVDLLRDSPLFELRRGVRVESVAPDGDGVNVAAKIWEAIEAKRR